MDTRERALGGDEALILGKGLTPQTDVWSLAWAETSDDGNERYEIVDASTRLCLGAVRMSVGIFLLDMMNCSGARELGPRWEFRPMEGYATELGYYKIISYGSEDCDGMMITVDADTPTAILTLDDETEIWTLPGTTLEPVLPITRTFSPTVTALPTAEATPAPTPMPVSTTAAPTMRPNPPATQTTTPTGTPTAPPTDNPRDVGNSKPSTVSDGALFAIVGGAFFCVSVGLLLGWGVTKSKQNPKVKEPEASQGETANPIGTSSAVTIQAPQVDPQDI